MASRAISIAILADAKNAVAGFKQTETASQRAARTINKGAKIAAAGFLAVGAGALKLAQGAAQDEQAASRLATQLRNTTGATRAQVSAVEDWISKQGELTGITDDELRPSLGQLATATGSVTKAQKLARLAMNIAAGSGKSLATVTNALSKAQTGSVAGLAKFGVRTKDAAGKARALGAVTRDLAAKFKGQTAKQAQTLAGKMQILKTQLSEAGETVGYALIPVLTTLANYLVQKGIPALQATFGYVAEHQTAFKVAGIAIAAFGAAFIAASAAMKVYAAIQVITTAATGAWTAAQWLLNAALTANPIGLIIVAIAALVAGIILAYKKSDTFRKIVNGAFKAVLGAAQFAFNWIKKYWPYLIAILGGPFAVAVVAIVRNWDKIKDGASKVKDYVKDKFGELIDFFRSLPGRVASAASGLFDGIKNAFRSAINYIIGAWNRLSFTLPSIKIPGLGSVGGGSFGTPDIPLLRSSTSTTAPTVSINVAVPPTADKAAIGRELLTALRAYQNESGVRIA